MRVAAKEKTRILLKRSKSMRLKMKDEIKKEWFTLKYGKRLESKFERPLIAFVSWTMHLIFCNIFYDLVFMIRVMSCHVRLKV